MTNKPLALVLAANGTLAFAAVCMLLALLYGLFPPLALSAEPSRAGELTGTWVVDVEASLDMPGVNRREIYSPQQITSAKAKAKTVHIIVDMVKKTVVYTMENKVMGRADITAVEEKNDAVILRFGEKEQKVTFLPGGRILAGPPARMVLIKKNDVPTLP